MIKSTINTLKSMSPASKPETDMETVITCLSSSFNSYESIVILKDQQNQNEIQNI